LVFAALWLASLAGTYFVLRATIAPQYARVTQELAQARRALAASDAEKTQLQRKLAQHERGEQVAERANSELQQALAARQEEIASLRSDLGFYQRLMEGGAQQPGVSVHSLVLRATDDPRAFQFALTLSQNLKRNRQASGTVELSVSGAAGQHSARLGLAELGGSGTALEFSFKYFQQLAGVIMRPEGFKPASVHLRVLPEGSGAVERELMWKDVVSEGDG
jgi:cell division protein FtsB